MFAFPKHKPMDKGRHREEARPVRGTWGTERSLGSRVHLKVDPPMLL